MATNPVTNLATNLATRPTRCKPDTLVLSGGGVRGVASLGALERLRRAGMLSKVTTVVGTSAGALVGAIVATKRDLRGALEAISSHGYKPSFDFDRLSREYGFDDGKVIESLLGSVLHAQDGGITFKGVLDKYGVRLVVCVTNVTRRSAEYLGPDTHPDMPISTAVRMSCSVPLYFGAVKYDDCWYVDGSIIDNFPCDWAAAHGAEWILGVSTMPSRGSIKSFESFLGAVMESATTCTSCARADILEIDVPGVSSLHFGANPTALRRLFLSGMHQADAFVKKRM